MTQNLLSLELSDEDIIAINSALTDIESRLAGRLVALDATSRRKLTKMGDKSEAFVRQTLMVLAQNPDVVPPALGLAEAQADIRAGMRCARSWRACSGSCSGSCSGCRIRRWRWAAMRWAPRWRVTRCSRSPVATAVWRR